jgi:hypothetical protein
LLPFVTSRRPWRDFVTRRSARDGPEIWAKPPSTSTGKSRGSKRRSKSSERISPPCRRPVRT